MKNTALMKTSAQIAILYFKVSRPRIWVKRTQFFNLPKRTPNKIPMLHSSILYPFQLSAIIQLRQNSTMVKCVNAGTIMPGFESWLCHCVTLKGSLNFYVPQCLHLRNRQSNRIYRQC